MPRLEQDRKLLDAFRAGRREAMAVVYREYAQLLARMLRAAGGGSRIWMLRSAFELENLVGEVFARAFEPQTRLAYDGLRPYESFLMGIARNCVHENARYRESARGLNFLDGAASPEAAPDSQVEDREVESVLAQFVVTLEEPWKSLFQVRFAEGKSQVEAAQALGCSRIVLRRRERKLKHQLLDFLQSRGYLRGLSPEGWTFVRREDAGKHES
jgi:RNA polymerase sigma-70 factor (ECF subfamily)